MRATSWVKAVVLAIASLGLAQPQAFSQRPSASSDDPLNDLKLQAQVAGIPTEPAVHFLLFMGRYDQALVAMVRTADLNAPDPEGRKPLTIAAGDQSAEAYDMVEALLKYGAEPEERDATGRTALHYAVEAGTMAVVQLLVDRHGADVNAPRLDAEGEPIKSEVPATIALVSGNPRIASFLEEHGADFPELTPSQEFRSIKAAHYKRLTASLNDPRLEPSPERSTRIKDSADIKSVTLALSEMGSPDVYIRHAELKLREFYRLLRDPQTRGLDGPEMWRRAREHADSRVDMDAYEQASIDFVRRMVPDGGER